MSNLGLRPPRGRARLILRPTFRQRSLLGGPAVQRAGAAEVPLGEPLANSPPTLERKIPVLSVTLTVLLQASLSASANDATYAAAHRVQAETGRPLVVLVGTDWCPACRQMKDRVIPQARRRGLLGRVAFAMVNADQDRALARKIMRGGSIPQLVMFEKTAGGWKRTQLTGAQSVEQIESMIREAEQRREIELSGGPSPTTPAAME